MVTNAVNHLLGLNPMGVFYSASGPYDTHLEWNQELLPICPNMIGGLLLFSKAIEEDAETVYQFSENMPIAYASNDVNSTANLARGSLNLTESKVLEDGYKFVWEFSPSQGNGSIAAVALTSARGGQNGFGSIVGDASPFLLVKSVNIGELSMDEQMPLFEAVEVDFEKNRVYSISFADASVIVKTISMPIFTIGLNERMDDSTYSIVDEQVLPVSVFQFLGSYSKHGQFMVGQDGYWYGISNEGNASGDAATPLFRYKEFLVGWGGSYGNEYRRHYLLMPYLASINNLGSPVVKTADKTMKITYTLTEEA